MNEKLPLLQKAIEQLKENEETELADELDALVATLFAQIEKKEHSAIQATEEKITQFLKTHEAEITIGDRQEELATLKGTISSDTGEKQKRQSSLRERLRGTDEEEEHETAQVDEEEEGSRRDSRGKKVALRGAALGGAFFALKWRGKNAPHTTSMERVASASVESTEYNTLSVEKKRTACSSYLMHQLGFSKLLTAAIIGNIQQESGFKTDALGDGGTSYGLCQWHDEPLGKGRRTDLKTFCASPAGRGRPITDYTLQLDFIKYELEGTEHKAYSLLKKAKTYEEATTIFVEKYERARSPHLENRLAYAETAYENMESNSNIA